MDVIEKLIVAKLLKLFPTMYRPQRSITMFTTTCDLSILSDRHIQSSPLHLISWRSVV